MRTIASQTTSLTIVYSTVYSGADQRKHQSSASLAIVRGIHRGTVNPLHKWPVTWKMFPFDDVIMPGLGTQTVYSTGYEHPQYRLHVYCTMTFPFQFEFELKTFTLKKPHFVYKVKILGKNYSGLIGWILLSVLSCFHHSDITLMLMSKLTPTSLATQLLVQ